MSNSAVTLSSGSRFRYYLAFSYTTVYCYYYYTILLLPSSSFYYYHCTILPSKVRFQEISPVLIANYDVVSKSIVKAISPLFYYSLPVVLLLKNHSKRCQDSSLICQRRIMINITRNNICFAIEVGLFSSAYVLVPEKSVLVNCFFWLLLITILRQLCVVARR